MRRQRSISRRFRHRGALLAAAAALVTGLRLGAPPAIACGADRPAIGPSTAVEAGFTAGSRGLGEVRLELSQGDRTIVLASREHQPRPPWKPWAPATREDRLTADAGWREQEGLE